MINKVTRYAVITLFNLSFRWIKNFNIIEKKYDILFISFALRL